jgi:hypothetical protein
MHVMHLKYRKAQQNGFITDLEPGEIKLELMTQHYLRKAQKAGGVIKYM